MPNITKNIEDKYRRLAQSVGRSFVNQAFPNDFEVYLMSFELLDSNNTTIEYFLFPVMPEEISESKKTLTTIKKTSSGVNSMFNPTFTPIDIKISGNFGRQFKMMLNNDIVALSGVFGKLINKGSVLSFKVPEFDISVKTGYGVTKKLQSLIDKSFSLDDNGRPHKLLFYNYALNTSYMVEIEAVSFRQDMPTNMIWQYSIEMTALAPTEYIFEKYKNSLNKAMSFSALSKVTQTVVKDLAPLAKNSINRILKIR
jgi:hypothetical protein